MATHQSKGQKATIERVMHEFKEGELKACGSGPAVKSRKQAIAIALHESGASNQESESKNKSNLRKTKAKEASGRTAEAEKEGRRAQDRTLAKGGNGGKEPASRGRSAGQGSKDDLYAEAKRRDVPGRSRMSKAELQKALGH